jgi:hypothetical protein
MSKKYSSSKTCIYCGALSGSEEHVFPEWLRNQFKGKGTLEHKVDIDSPIRFKKGVKDLRITVRSVCVECNNGWMSKLQNDAKPLITELLHESTTTLDLAECKLLTSWAVMSAMCLESRNKREVWKYGELDHTLFFTKREIPKNTDVWICYWANSPGPSYDGRILSSLDKRGYVATFGFGNLVYQVLQVVPVDSNNLQQRKISIEAPWDQILIPIRYPKNLPISWPPKNAIQGDPGINALESRLVRPPT